MARLKTSPVGKSQFHWGQALSKVLGPNQQVCSLKFSQWLMKQELEAPCDKRSSSSFHSKTSSPTPPLASCCCNGYQRQHALHLQYASEAHKLFAYEKVDEECGAHTAGGRPVEKLHRIRLFGRFSLHFVPWPSWLITQGFFQEVHVLQEAGPMDHAQEAEMPAFAAAPEGRRGP